MYVYIYIYLYYQGSQAQSIKEPQNSMAEPLPKTIKIIVFKAFGVISMSEMDSEGHFASDCMSRMSGSSARSPKPNILMLVWDIRSSKGRKI